MISLVYDKLQASQRLDSFSINSARQITFGSLDRTS